MVGVSNLFIDRFASSVGFVNVLLLLRFVTAAFVVAIRAEILSEKKYRYA